MQYKKTPRWAVITSRALLFFIFLTSFAFLIKAKDETYLQALGQSLVFFASIAVPAVIVSLLTITAMGGPTPWEFLRGGKKHDIEDRPG